MTINKISALLNCTKFLKNYFNALKVLKSQFKAMLTTTPLPPYQPESRNGDMLYLSPFKKHSFFFFFFFSEDRISSEVINRLSDKAALNFPSGLLRNQPWAPGYQ